MLITVIPGNITKPISSHLSSKVNPGSKLHFSHTLRIDNLIIHLPGKVKKVLKGIFPQLNLQQLIMRLPLQSNLEKKTPVIFLEYQIFNEPIKFSTKSHFRFFDL
jgi:hypothetical protein